MNPFETALAQLPAKPLATILQTLAAIRQRANRGEAVQMPCTTFHLRSGRDIDGWLLDVRQEKQTTMVLIHANACNQVVHYHVAYVALGDIEAITVHDAATFAPVLSFGQVQRAPGHTSPTLMALRRRAEAISGPLPVSDLMIELDFGLQDTDDDDTRYQFSDGLETLAGILTDMSNDAVGRDALNALAIISLQVGDGLQVQRQHDHIRITLPPVGQPVVRQALYDALSREL